MSAAIQGDSERRSIIIADTLNEMAISSDVRRELLWWAMSRPLGCDSFLAELSCLRELELDN
jgi:hypothetical protein